jgi:ribosome-binding ATPase
MGVSIGVVGKPNAGKSTFFSALTLADAKIAPFPFTTIEPNRGVAYIRRPCPHTILGKPCKPRDSSCVNGNRFIPIAVTDVAGIVPGAHEGRGLGLQFLDDIRQADALIQVVDASGRTDLEGQPAEDSDPCAEVEFLKDEIAHWMFSILQRNWSKVSGKGLVALNDVLVSMKLPEGATEKAVRELGLGENAMWKEEDRMRFARKICEAKPMLIAANKWDSAGKNAKALLEKYPGMVVPCASAYELALRKADAAGVIEYVPGSDDFAEKKATPEQARALASMRAYLKANKGTGVQDALERTVAGMLGLIAVYPVEDESKWSDRNGNVLPNVFLMRKGTTAIGMAGKIHTDLAKSFISAIDAKRKLRMGKDHELADGDVVKIVSGS